ncbi:nicotinate-nucleotide adenylyltransferase [Demequina zhanjiangensis]|uniref:Probable nicotinate-nucleotide adenylyltransferase n=1 Tax=Demequina zhanjiangensis TaxID=3051659 RepID=A0ABT8G014_9MICO|nr:nicotinate-nucleotide adenylyltransferase [Demequina sp. SYSU T00b26]MDN4472413.1 nicotinate-nucleotide adenylyltransferase [Demequina sp. SYSU T00b26]
MPDLRVGVLGGTFDPIHHGHLAAASEVRAALDLDRVLLVPTAAQPFKDAHGHAPVEHRLAMCRRAVAEDPYLEVSTVDIDRGGTTYTVDTLADLQSQQPEARLFFIAGADALARLSEWRDADRLLELATFVAVTRPGHVMTDSSGAFAVVEAPALDVSSTDVRRRVGEGRPIRYLVPHAVADYIEEHDLYSGGRDD